MILYGDLETFNTRDLKSVGNYAYAETAEITLFAYAIDDGPVQCWDMTTRTPMPADLEAALINSDCLLVFHNGGQFDRLVIREQITPRAPAERWYDTMVQAMAHSLPGSLDTLCDLFKLNADEAKMKDGRALVLKFCKLHDGKRYTRETHPDEWARFIQYAKQDVESMRILHKRMPKWNYSYPTGPDDDSPGAREWRLWCLDQRINDRGLRIDTVLAEKAIKLVADEKARLKGEAQELTDGLLESTTKRDQMLKYLLDECGVSLPDLTASTIDRRLQDPDLPDGIKLLLENRLQSTTVSTAKYKTLMRSLTADGRLCGHSQFCGAGRTGRWSARRFQPHNMARPDVKASIVDLLVEAVKNDIDIELVCNTKMKAVSNMLRACILPG